MGQGLIESEVSARVTVAIRVKPLDDKETLQDLCVHPHDEHPNTSLIARSGRGESTYNFDHVHWTVPADGRFCALAKPPVQSTQESIYSDLGVPVVANALRGFNCSIFVYGQTGSGKSYTMMGAESGGPQGPSRGLIPRISEALFQRTSETAGDGTESGVTGRFQLHHLFVVTYIEIYKEKCHDLLSPPQKGHDSPAPLKLRQDKKTGPFVEGATRVQVTTFDEMLRLIQYGNGNRIVASTNMNAVSSRSHAIFTVQYTKRKQDLETGAILDMCSKLNLIDLAGSESAGTAGTTGERLKEGGYINKSLLTLGMVIKALAEQDNRRGDRGSSRQVIPYRDSALTFLLKDSLGGNARTTMIATIRPSIEFTEETMSTLRYADRAKSIVNFAVINEDPLTKKIRELEEQIQRLTTELMSSHEREQDKAAQIQNITEQLLRALSNPPPPATPVFDGRDSPCLTPNGRRQFFDEHGGSFDDSSRRSSTLGVLTPLPLTAAALEEMLLRATTPTTMIPAEESPPPSVAVTRENSLADSPAPPPPPAPATAPLEDPVTPPSDPVGPPPLPSPAALLKKAEQGDSWSEGDYEEDEQSASQPGPDAPAPRKSSSVAPPPPAAASSTDLTDFVLGKDNTVQLAWGQSVASPGPTIEGFLLKRGRAKGFKRRYFILRDNLLYYFLTWNNANSIRGGMRLTGCKVIDVDAAATGMPFTFTIHASAQMGDREWTLQASNEDEKRRWFDACVAASASTGSDGTDLAFQAPMSKLFGGNCVVS